MRKPVIEDVYVDGPTTCVVVDGKIISSEEVNDMIDALISMRSYLKICLINFEREDLDESAKYTEKRIDEVEKALTKAGAKFEQQTETE